MSRPTKTIELPFSKSKVEIYTYLLAKDMVGILNETDTRKFTLENLVASIDGNIENLYSRIMEMHVDDYNVIDVEISKLINDAIDKKKQLLNTTTTSEVKEN